MKQSSVGRCQNRLSPSSEPQLGCTTDGSWAWWNQHFAIRLTQVAGAPVSQLPGPRCSQRRMPHTGARGALTATRRQPHDELLESAWPGDSSAFENRTPRLRTCRSGRPPPAQAGPALAFVRASSTTPCRYQAAENSAADMQGLRWVEALRSVGFAGDGADTAERLSCPPSRHGGSHCW